MVNRQLLDPRSIVVVGGSEQIQKPGGKLLHNLINGNFPHPIYVVNPKAEYVQGIKCHASVDDIPGDIDLAVLAIPAALCVDAVETLAYKKNTRAFIIISAGFGEESHDGALLERRIVDIVNDVNGSLIGPNCIGVLTSSHCSVFTEPVPVLNPQGIDFITGSGATAVFILEAAIGKGLIFNSVFSVGNSAQMGVEEVLQYMDENYVHGVSPAVKLLYMESVRHPHKLLKHARSLTAKGCRIAAIKAGESEAGSRAASSHTGAMAGNDKAVDALFAKAGIVRCHGREELVNVAAVMSLPALKGNRIAIITHAGGPAVMLTDTLSRSNMQVPPIAGAKADALLARLFPGSSVGNPIDFLATGTAAQLSDIIDAVNNDFDDIDGMVVIFGSPGLFSAHDAYSVLNNKMKLSPKPIFPVLPSIVNVKDDIDFFISEGNVCFNDEVVMGEALCKVFNNRLFDDDDDNSVIIDVDKVRAIIDSNSDGYLSPSAVQELLDAAGIARAKEYVTSSADEVISMAHNVGYPLVMKVVGPVHKSDVGGVVLNVSDDNMLLAEFKRLMTITDANAVLLQPMLRGHELFVGASRESGYSHLVMFGLGGIFVEVLKDVSMALTPISRAEAKNMISQIKGYAIIEGIRGDKGVDKNMLENIILRLSALLNAAPEIAEMDINPLIGSNINIVAVDARVRLKRPEC